MADTQLGTANLLHNFIATEGHTLRAILRLYLSRAGLPTDDPTLDDLLHDVIQTALAHADRFDPARPPRAWLLGIAANLVRRRQTESAKRQHREPLVTDMGLDPAGTFSEEELFDRLAGAYANQPAAPPEATLEQQQGAEALLALVSEADQQVLRLAIIHEMDGEQLAAALHIKPGAARVRLHRALQRLRAAVLRQEVDND